MAGLRNKTLSGNPGRGAFFLFRSVNFLNASEASTWDFCEAKCRTSVTSIFEVASNR